MRKSARNSLLFVVLAASLPITLIAMISLGFELRNFFNPCMVWEAATGGSVALFAGARCSTGAQASSETALAVAARLSLIQGGILVAVALGMLGVLRSRPKLLIFGSSILLAESFPLVFDGLLVFTLLSAGFFILAARRLSRIS
jgi:hypothetical protein